MPRHKKKIRQINPDGTPRTFRLPGVLGPDLVYTPGIPEPKDTPSAPQKANVHKPARAQAAPGTHGKPGAAKNPRTPNAPAGTPSRQARRAKCLKGILCVAGCMMSERHNAPGFRSPGGKCLKDTLSNIKRAPAKIPTRAAAAPASQKPKRQQSILDIVGKKT